MTQAVIPLEPNRLLAPSSLGLTQLEALLAEAAIYVKSGLLPSSVNTPEKAVLIMAAGHELGIPKTYALRNIHVIQGRPTCSAELMMALVQRDHGRDAVRVVETDEQHCTVVVKDGGHTCRYSWTMADAQRAGLAGRDTWKQYPRAMLRARAISEACRATFPGSIGGLYMADEIAPVDERYQVVEPRQLAAVPKRLEPEPAATDETGDWAPLEVTSWGDVPAAPIAHPLEPDQPDPADRATERQLAAIRAHLKRIGEDNEEAVARSAGAATLEALSREAASTLVGQLSREPNAAE